MARKESWEMQLQEGLAKKDMIETVMLISAVDEVKVYLALGEFFLGNNTRWVFPVLERPSKYYTELLKKGGLDTSKISFIDVGTNYRVGSYIDSPRDMIELKREIVSIADRLMSSNPRPEKVVFVFGSFVTLALFNDNREIGIFVHELTLALRQLGVYMVFLIPPDDPIIRYILPVMDYRLRVG